MEILPQEASARDDGRRPKWLIEVEYPHQKNWMRKKERDKTPIMVATMFCLQRPRAAHSLHFNFAGAEKIENKLLILNLNTS